MAWLFIIAFLALCVGAGIHKGNTDAQAKADIAAVATLARRRMNHATGLLER